MKKIFIHSFLLTLCIFPLTMNSADVFEWSYDKVNIISDINDKMISDYSKLNSNYILVKSFIKLENPWIYSKCNISSSVSFQKNIKDYYLYLIRLSIEDAQCLSSEIYIKNGDVIFTDTNYNLNIYNYNTNFIYFSDFSDNDIKNEITKLDSELYWIDNKIAELNKSKDLSKRIELLRNIYKERQNEYYINFLKEILEKRENLTYLSPVENKSLPTKKNLMPNAPRPYRVKYTDWIHHGYDIFASKWTPVRSLWDSVVIRIVNDFKWSDFDKILWNNLTYFDKLKNLDIYRWNQVWLKTADWNVTFYAHLDSVDSNLKVWQYVNKWTYLWNIWSSWVPDKWYKDFHLHFEIQVNPHSKLNNNYDEIMEWNYLWQDKSYNELISLQSKLFWNNNIAYK